MKVLWHWRNDLETSQRGGSPGKRGGQGGANRGRLARLGWKEEDLERRQKNDPGKLALAARLRKETVLSTKSIPARVRLGRYNTAAANLRSGMQEVKTTVIEKMK